MSLQFLGVVLGLVWGAGGVGVAGYWSGREDRFYVVYVELLFEFWVFVLYGGVGFKFSVEIVYLFQTGFFFRRVGRQFVIRGLEYQLCFYQRKSCICWLWVSFQFRLLQDVYGVFVVFRREIVLVFIWFLVLRGFNLDFRGQGVFRFYIIFTFSVFCR